MDQHIFDLVPQEEANKRKNLDGLKRFLAQQLLVFFVFVIGKWLWRSSVGRVVVSDTRGPRSNPVISNLNTVATVLKLKKKEKKRPGMAQFLKGVFVWC